MGSWFYHILFPQGLHTTESIWKKNFLFSMEKVARLEKNHALEVSMSILSHGTSVIKHLLVTQQENQWDSIDFWGAHGVVIEMPTDYYYGYAECWRGQQGTDYRRGRERAPRDGEDGWEGQTIPCTHSAGLQKTLSWTTIIPFPEIKKQL